VQLTGTIHESSADHDKNAKKRDDIEYPMSLATLRMPTIEPQGEEPVEVIKIYRKLAGYYTMVTRRNGAVDHEAGTVETAMTSTLTSILCKCSTDDANVIMQCLSRMQYDEAKAFLETPDPESALRAFTESWERDGGESWYTIDHKTVNSMIPGLTREEMNQEVAEDAIACKEELAKDDACASDEVIALDDTGDPVKTSHPNGEFVPVRIGQKKVIETGLEQHVEYDATNNLFMGTKQHDNWGPAGDPRSMESWTRSVAAKVAREHAAGRHVKALHMDRGFFLGVVFAISILGLFLPGAPAGDQPRLVMPRKFTGEKSTYKWEYLLDPSKPQVFTEWLVVDTSKCRWLKPACEAALEHESGDRYWVPYACVALAGEYAGNDKLTLADLRAKARIVQDSIERTTKELARAERAYKKLRKKITGRKASNPSYGRGQRRRSFKGAHAAEDKHLYRECLRLHAELAEWNRRKAALIKSLLFFGISLRPGEDLSKNPGEFIDLAKDYHARWGIENGIREMKHKFRRAVRSTKPTRHQFFTILAMIIYNHWQVVRKKEIVAWLRAHGKVVEFVHITRRWIRIPWEQEIPDLTSAVSFLASIWSYTFTQLIKQKIKEVQPLP
jgi:hypothetical protein